MLDLPRSQLGLELNPATITVPPGERAEVDGADASRTALAGCSAHHSSTADRVRLNEKAGYYAVRAAAGVCHVDARYRGESCRQAGLWPSLPAAAWMAPGRPGRCPAALSQRLAEVDR
jgi:hypothetical protein